MSLVFVAQSKIGATEHGQEQDERDKKTSQMVERERKSLRVVISNQISGFRKRWEPLKYRLKFFFGSYRSFVVSSNQRGGLDKNLKFFSNLKNLTWCFISMAFVK